MQLNATCVSGKPSPIFLPLFPLLICFLGSADANAATYYVDNTNGSASDTNPGTTPAAPWRTIGKAARSLAAGDTVIVIAGGAYDERVVPANSGTAGQPIVYLAGSGTRPRVRGFTITGRNHITVRGLEITHAGFSSDSAPGVDLTGTIGVQIVNNHIHHTTSISIMHGRSSTLRIAGNQISHAGFPKFPQAEAGIAAAYGEPNADVLIENNQVSFVSDYVTPYGTRYVIRGNVFGPAEPRNSQHIDGVQPNGTTTDSLLEGNVSINNASSDNHFFLNQLDGSDGWIIRYNVVLRSNGGLDWRNADRHYFYNNTFYDTYTYWANSFQILMTNSTGNVVRNNIWYHASSGNPYSFDSGSSVSKDYDLWFNQGNPGEAHSVNADPAFANAAGGDFRLKPGSPAIDAGGALMFVSPADSGAGAVLAVTDAGFFQDGWAGVPADWIAIGSPNNTVQIASIDRTTNMLNLASPVSRVAGQPIWLFRSSNGSQVLFGGAPDIGAFESNASTGDTTPPVTAITTPQSNATVSGSTVLVSASASDNAGVAGVQFKLDGMDLSAEDTASPYSVVWNTLSAANGSHTLSAVARDAAGNQTTSQPVVVFVSNAAMDTTAPAVSIASHANGSLLSGSVTLRANATDNVGVAGVQFRVDGVNIGAEDLSSPYTAVWNTRSVPNGFHVLTAVARDGAGNQTVSQPVSVLVVNLLF
jgi:hypothetical protein